MGVAKVTSKGQVTIPVEVREQFGIEPGDQLVFYAGLDRQLHVRIRRPRVGAGRGMIDHDGALLSRSAIGEAVAAGVQSRSERARSKRRRGKAA